MVPCFDIAFLFSCFVMYKEFKKRKKKKKRVQYVFA